MAVLEFQIEGEVAVMTLNRPEARNAVNGPLMEAMSEAYAEIERNPAIRVGVVTGAGGNFCSGMDLKAFAGGEIDVGAALERRKAELVVQKPMIAAVEGYALGGGFELVLRCDLAVAAKTAKFGLPETRYGLVAGGGGLVRLPRLAPSRIALEMILTGDVYEASMLHMHGLINRLTEEGGALASALDLAQRIARNGPLAVAVSKRVVQRAGDWPMDEALERQREHIEPVFASADAKEGARAFAEKRTPRWTGA